MIVFHGMLLPAAPVCAHLVETDWAASPLGLPARWPAVLKSTVELCLNARCGMLLIWGEQRAIIGNEAALTILGPGLAAAFGQPLDVASPALAEVLEPLLAQVRERRSGIGIEHRPLLIERDGQPEEVFLRFSTSPLFAPDGSVGGVLCLMHDATDEQLRNRRLETLSRLSTALSKLASRDRLWPEIQQIMAGNPIDFARTAVLELGPDRAPPTVHWSLPQGYGEDLVEAGVIRDIAAWLPQKGTHRLVRPIAERRHVLGMVESASLGQRRFVMVLEPDRRVRIDRDYELLLRMLLDTIVGAGYRMLLERQAVAHMEVELGARDRLYRALFEHSHDGVLICGPSGRILAANPAACELLGYSEDELRVIGRNGFVSDEDGALSRALEVRDRERRFTGELQFVRKDGTPIPMDVSSTLFDDEQTGHGRAVVFFRDASARLASQRRIATDARLQAIGELTGGIAHDFNNLLNVIINGAEILAERLGSDSDAQLVLTASLRAAELTRQLLAFSRQQPMRVTAVELDRTLQEMDQILNRAIGGAIEVTVAVKRGVAVQADPALLQSAILNLCINARDAMPDGGHLGIRGGVEHVPAALADELGIPEGSYGVLRVEDDGVGIAPEALGRVLEPFYTTKPGGKGTGLGLSSVFGFVRQSGGGMRVSSELGRGTTVALYLPRADAPAAEAAGPAPEALPAERPREPRVLLVEDDDLFSAMLGGMLERAGYRVTVRANAEGALAVLDSDASVDLLITDILLGPGPDGWSVAAHAGHVRPGLPVITMSGFAPSERNETGAPVTLTKPFRPREILQAIARELRG